MLSLKKGTMTRGQIVVRMPAVALAHHALWYSRNHPSAKAAGNGELPVFKHMFIPASQRRENGGDVTCTPEKRSPMKKVGDKFQVGTA